MKNVYTFPYRQSAIHTFRQSNYAKEQRDKSMSSSNSTFMYVPMQKITSEEDHIDKKKLAYGVISIKKPKYDEYMIEIDNHKQVGYHFHVWKSDRYNKISDTRSQAISLHSSIKNGIVYLPQERKNEFALKSNQELQMLYFIEENRHLLFLMIEAFRQGKVKSFDGLDEEMVLSLFGAKEIERLDEKYGNKFSDFSQFGE